MAYRPEHYSQDIYAHKSTLTVDPFNEKSESTRSLPTNLCIAGASSEFHKITLTEKNILLYFWSPSNELKARVEGLKFSQLPDCSIEVANSQKIAELSAIPADPLITQILSEMNQPLQDFANLLPDRALKISFFKTLDRSCPLFHVDRVSLRLLCTFRGSGTDWIPNNMVNRNRLGCGENKKIVKPEAIIQQVKPFQICILKGEIFPGNRGKGVVHRSPAVPDREEGRWFMRVDAI